MVLYSLKLTTMKLRIQICQTFNHLISHWQALTNLTTIIKVNIQKSAPRVIFYNPSYAYVTSISHTM